MPTGPSRPLSGGGILSSVGRGNSPAIRAAVRTVSRLIRDTRSSRPSASTSKEASSAAAGCGRDDAGLVGAVEALPVLDAVGVGRRAALLLRRGGQRRGRGEAGSAREAEEAQQAAAPRAGRLIGGRRRGCGEATGAGSAEGAAPEVDLVRHAPFLSRPLVPASAVMGGIGLNRCRACRAASTDLRPAPSPAPSAYCGPRGPACRRTRSRAPSCTCPAPRRPCRSWP